ncbi:MAG: alpha/beta hydrolase, partial [Acidimicrobiia bacterium]|nr:alpha/beta hydrolase [Acidimicrobiia bacterium]
MSDPRAADMLLASMVESFRPGSDGSAWEARLLILPWGFGLEDIAVPVALGHGDADINSPLTAATYLSRTIPNASLTFSPDEGHFL